MHTRPARPPHAEHPENRVLVIAGDVLQIGRLPPDDLTCGATPARSAEVLPFRDTLTALTTQAAEPRGRLGQADSLVDTPREQLTGPPSVAPPTSQARSRHRR